ncbi:hypothetical protein [Polynucleobacter sp.]|uniref:hypothetical protein n=1 Tax=Polynucleobacter sp. TaxID=2029855 RepID=UPI003F6972FE
MKYLAKRLQERSTWNGIIALAALAACIINPAQAEVIIKSAVAAAGILHVSTPD